MLMINCTLEFSIKYYWGHGVRLGYQVRKLGKK